MTLAGAGGLQNEALQQTRPAITSIGAVLAAERWCSAGRIEPDRRRG